MLLNYSKENLKPIAKFGFYFLSNLKKSNGQLGVTVIDIVI